MIYEEKYIDFPENDLFKKETENDVYSYIIGEKIITTTIKLIPKWDIKETK